MLIVNESTSVVTFVESTVNAASSDGMRQQWSEEVFAAIRAQYPNHLLVMVGERFDLSEIVTACAPYRRYQGKRGVEANYSIEQLVRSLLVKRLYNWSYRQTERSLCTDLLVRWFAHFSLTQQTPDHTTLQRFESWVLKHQPRAFFSCLLQQIDEDFPEERHATQYGDTFAMRTRASDPSQTGLLRDITQRLWRAYSFATQNQRDVSALLPLFQAVMGPDDEPHPFLLSPQERNQRTLDTAGAALLLLAAIEASVATLSCSHKPAVLVLLQWMARLQKLLTDDYMVEWDETGSITGIRFCTNKERGAYRIISAIDPDATIRNHGKSIDRGYNVSVAATANFVREIAAVTGATPDSVGIAPLVAAQLEHLRIVPPKLVYDQAGGMAKIIADVDKASQGQTQLVVRLIDSKPQSNRFGPQDFSLTESGLTCPNNQTATRFSRSGSADGWDYCFLPEQCVGCPLWHQCRDPKAKPDSRRRVFISDYTLYSRQAIAYTKTDDFKQEMKQRAHIERIIAALVRFNGARHAESFGLEHADYQARMAATAYNLKRWTILIRRLQRQERRFLVPHPASA
jgi:transposase